MSEINKGLDECLEYISRMSKGERMQMCIPAQNSDWDLVMFRAIRAAQARITELETLSLQGRVGLMTAEEWAATTPEARHRMNVYVMNAEKLAGLVRILLDTSAYNHPGMHGPIRAEVERLARELAPVQSGSGTVTLFSPDGIDVVADKAPHEPGTYTIFGGPAETGEPGTARFVRDECACKFPGLSVSGPSICPTCGKPHRLQFTKGE